jgi:branched-chain amino acid transport system ATP-binding protein
MAFLEIKNLSKFFGGVKAVDDFTYSLDHGRLDAIIGPNGAGKSTLLNTISGLVRASSGEIIYEGQPLSKRAHQVVAQGIAQVPEGRQVFANLSVKANLLMGAFLRRDRAGITQDLERVYHIFPRLQEREKQIAGSLSGGEQQMLAIGRGLMSHPKLMLMDEPSLGLAPLLVKDIFKVLREINDEGTTLLLVEQNARKALSIAHRAYVLETGEIVREGSGEDLLKDPVVQEAYLGTKRTRTDA